MSRILDIGWEEPLEAEKEPQYTARVLAPVIAEYVVGLGHKTLVMRHDGGDRPHPVSFDGQRFFPDLAIYDAGSRELAIEVKYLNHSSYSEQLKTAIGQGIIYRSFGYRCSIVILVTKRPHRVLSEKTLKELNSSLEPLRVGVAQLAS